jgi:hypothetical protein
MAKPVQDADAAFFNLMHHFLAASTKAENGAGGNSRGSERRSFRLIQRIAPGYCWEVPPPSAWIEVHCYDLAQAGFSFFLDDKPSFERLVVMFRAGEPIYVAARVDHWRPVVVDAWGGIVDASSSPAGASALESASKVLVGCSFLRRFSDTGVSPGR